MKFSLHRLISLALLLGTLSVDGQFSKVDSTLKVGKTGYRLICPNKTVEKNHMEIKPIGFENTARVLDFYIKGYVTKLEIDDLNADGYPDLVVYINLNDSLQSKTIYVFASDASKSIIPLALPDVQLDGKLREGYRGHNQVMMLEGTLILKFPIYKPGDSNDKPTGGFRTVLYKMVRAGEMEVFKFIVQHTYDTK